MVNLGYPEHVSDNFLNLVSSSMLRILLNPGISSKSAHEFLELQCILVTNKQTGGENVTSAESLVIRVILFDINAADEDDDDTF